MNCRDEKNNEKMTQKAFLRGIAISVLSIFLCMAAFCSATYAWFVGGEKNVGNSIVSGSFELKIGVVRREGASSTEEIAITYTETSVSCVLPEAGTYTVTLERKDGATTNGYCYVTVDAGQPQATETISAAVINGKSTDPLVFTIVAEKGATVSFNPSWGIPADPVIKHGDTIQIEV